MRIAPRLILGIETSCDETAAAVVRDARVVLSNVISGQHDLHSEYRGVVPEIASRAHAERLVPVVRRALDEAQVTIHDIDAVAVGNRPGLIGSLLVGVAGAKALAWSLAGAAGNHKGGRPVAFVAVDHVHAHLIACALARPDQPRIEVAFPAIGLVVSGGHTSLYRLESAHSPVRIGATIDDAIGEAYDKVAAALALPFPGGPHLDRLAQSAPPLAQGFPIARLSPSSLDFSFSGLKTAALYAYRGVPETAWVRDKRARRAEAPPPTYEAAAVAATFQHAAVETVILKLERALGRHPDTRTLLVGGGVSANSHLRQRLARLSAERSLPVLIPEIQYCLDNGAMIAALAFDLLAARANASDPWSISAVPTSAL